MENQNSKTQWVITESRPLQPRENAALVEHRIQRMRERGVLIRTQVVIEELSPLNIEA